MLEFIAILLIASVFPVFIIEFIKECGWELKQIYREYRKK
jgi:hypothetical protein